jgi:hypothetical protein
MPKKRPVGRSRGSKPVVGIPVAIEIEDILLVSGPELDDLARVDLPERIRSGEGPS